MTVKAGRGSLGKHGPRIGIIVCRTAGVVVADVRDSAFGYGPYLRIEQRVWDPVRAHVGNWDHVQSHVLLDGRTPTADADCPRCSSHTVDLIALERAVRQGLAAGERSVLYLV